MIDKAVVNQIIKALYNNYAEFEDVTYDNVDRFYCYLGYELEINQVLSSIGVNGTSDLLDLLESAEYQTNNTQKGDN